jgi:hypothetical protein
VAGHQGGGHQAELDRIADSGDLDAADADVRAWADGLGQPPVACPKTSASWCMRWTEPSSRRPRAPVPECLPRSASATMPVLAACGRSTSRTTASRPVRRRQRSPGTRPIMPGGSRSASRRPTTRVRSSSTSGASPALELMAVSARMSVRQRGDDFARFERFGRSHQNRTYYRVVTAPRKPRDMETAGRRLVRMRW